MVGVGCSGWRHVIVGLNLSDIIWKNIIRVSDDGQKSNIDPSVDKLFCTVYTLKKNFLTKLGVLGHCFTYDI